MVHYSHLHVITLRRSLLQPGAKCSAQVSPMVGLWSDSVPGLCQVSHTGPFGPTHVARMAGCVRHFETFLVLFLPIDSATSILRIACRVATCGNPAFMLRPRCMTHQRWQDWDVQSQGCENRGRGCALDMEECAQPRLQRIALIARLRNRRFRAVLIQPLQRTMINYWTLITGRQKVSSLVTRPESHDSPAGWTVTSCRTYLQDMCLTYWIRTRYAQLNTILWISNEMLSDSVGGCSQSWDADIDNFVNGHDRLWLCLPLCD